MSKKNLAAFLLFGVIAVFCFLPASFYPSIASKSDNYLDTIFYLLHKPHVKSGDIVVVAIDDESLRRQDNKWPWSRTLYAQALDILGEEQAKVVGFDLVFFGQGQDSSDDRVFAEAIKKFPGEVVLAYLFDKRSTAFYPRKEFMEKSRAGFINISYDPDGIARRLAGMTGDRNLPIFSFSAQMAAAFYNTQCRIQAGGLRIADRSVPLYPDGKFLIQYLVEPADVTIVPFYKLLEHDFKPGLFRNKLVLVGPVAGIIHDAHPTPLGGMPGVFLHVNGLTNILQGRVIRPLPIAVELLFLIAVLLLLGSIMHRWSFLPGVVLTAGVLLGFFWLAVALKYFGWHIQFGRISAAALVYIVLGNAYAYAAFFFRLQKIKNKMTIDPVTNLHNRNYFHERVSLDYHSIPTKFKYIFVVIMDGLEFSLRGYSLAKTKLLWHDMADFLLNVAPLWAKCEPELIVAAATQRSGFAGLPGTLEMIARESGASPKVKCGIYAIDHKASVQNILPVLISLLKQSDGPVVEFSPQNLLSVSNKSGDGKGPDILDGMDFDAEDKNRQLLYIIEQLKNEEKKTKDAYLQMMASLVTALESKDRYTNGHSQRVCQYAVLLADEMGIVGQEREDIRKAAILHDLGKIGIPDHILHKKGKLSEDEYMIIKQHEVMSAKILEPIKEFESIIPGVLHHHERYDGTGYPHGLSGQMIPLSARIIAIADVFDALTTGRDYKDAFPVADSVKELQRVKGAQFDPALVDKFVQALKKTNILP